MCCQTVFNDIASSDDDAIDLWNFEYGTRVRLSKTNIEFNSSIPCFFLLFTKIERIRFKTAKTLVDPTKKNTFHWFVGIFKPMDG